MGKGCCGFGAFCGLNEDSFVQACIEFKRIHGLDVCFLLAQINVKRIHGLEVFGGAAGQRCCGFSAFCGFNEVSFVQARLEFKSIRVRHFGLCLGQMQLKRIHVLDGGFLLTTCMLFGRDSLDWFIIDVLKQGGLFILVSLQACLEFSFTFRVTREALCVVGLHVEPWCRGGPDLRQR